MNANAPDFFTDIEAAAEAKQQPARMSGLRRVAALCGGITVKSCGKTARYDRNGKRVTLKNRQAASTQ